MYDYFMALELDKVSATHEEESSAQSAEKELQLLLEQARITSRMRQLARIHKGI